MGSYRLTTQPPAIDAKCDFYTSPDFNKQAPIVRRCDKYATKVLDCSYSDQLNICDDCLKVLPKEKFDEPK